MINRRFWQHTDSNQNWTMH